MTLTGRISSKRESSAKLIFYDIVQNGETFQVVASRNRYQGTPQEFEDANRHLCRGDIVCRYFLSALHTKKKEKKTYMKQAFTGVPGKTNHGQLSIFVTNEMKVLSPCLHDIPRTGLKDPVSLRKIYSLRF